MVTLYQSSRPFPNMRNPNFQLVGGEFGFLVYIMILVFSDYNKKLAGAFSKVGMLRLNIHSRIMRFGFKCCVVFRVMICIIWPNHNQNIEKTKKKATKFILFSLKKCYYT